ncbi:MAG: 6-pyruvoyl tetrahydropterin synthase family protein [Bernardetiaceae bacterium]
MPKVAVLRKAEFSAAHRLHNPEWSASENAEIFDKCNNANFHGHNYQLLVRVVGEINPETGYVMDMKDLKELIDQEVITPFGHQNLNQTDTFRSLNPTAENIAVVIWNRLKARLGEQYELKITLYETERNIVEYPA